MARNNMKTVVLNKRSKHDVLHIEAPGCIINIRHGLTNRDGQAVTSINVIPDDHYAGEKAWRVVADGWDASGINVRVVEDADEPASASKAETA